MLELSVCCLIKSFYLLLVVFCYSFLQSTALCAVPTSKTLWTYLAKSASQLFWMSNSSRRTSCSVSITTLNTRHFGESRALAKKRASASLGTMPVWWDIPMANYLYRLLFCLSVVLFFCHWYFSSCQRNSIFNHTVFVTLGRIYCPPALDVVIALISVVDVLSMNRQIG